jgi:uncharacterized OB-fold protein
MGVKAISDGLFTLGDQPRLIGGRSRSSGVTTFPYQQFCPRTAAEDMERVELSPRGTLWSWTIQGFPPKRPPYEGPEPFEPFGLGYVELPGEVRVESRLTVADPDQLRIGMPMQLVLIPWSTDDEGNQIVTYAFAPVEES